MVPIVSPVFLIAFAMITIARKSCTKQLQFISLTIGESTLHTMLFYITQLYFLLLQIFFDQALQCPKYIFFFWTGHQMGLA